MQHARTIILAALLAGLGIGAAWSATPSFNCRKAQSLDERTICGDARLAELDRAVAKAYAQVKKKEPEYAASTAKETLAARQACGADRLCILDQQVRAITGFIDLGAKGSVPNWVGGYRLTLFKGRQPTEGLPGRVAQCTFTKIKSISDRFGGPLKPPTDKFDSSGTGIIFADGGTQVSYGYVRDIARSKVGDRVLLCLVSIPQNCPPGDDRGRFYSGTNVRTKGSWILPDSQHMCGGA
jgi:uncharacterized protein YecT (DUF1311 family)